MLKRRPSAAADDAHRPEPELPQAAAAGDASRVAALLLDGADPDDCDGKGWPALVLACHHGHTAVAAALLDAGANIQLADWSYTWFPLHTAAHSGHADAAALLLGRGARVDQKNSREETALHFAAKQGHAAVAAALIEAGARVRGAVDDEGHTPLHAAAMHDHAAVAALLLAAEPGALRQPSRWGKTPLQVTRSADVLEAFVAAGADVNGTGWPTPLYKAIRIKNAASVAVLLAAGAQLDRASRDGESPLHVAVEAGSPAVVQQLIDVGAPLEARNRKGKTPLAVAGFNAPVVDVLLRAGASAGTAGRFAQERAARLARLAQRRCWAIVVLRGATAFVPRHLVGRVGEFL